MKVTGSYPTIVRGVSQQVPQDRFPGQHYEQVNLMSDPVRGLARRHGTINRKDNLLAGTVSYGTLAADSTRMVVYTFMVAGVEYDLLYRTTAVTSDSPVMYLFNKATGELVPIEYDTAQFNEDIRLGGISAVTSVGKYLLIAGKTTKPSYTTINSWSDTASSAVCWLRSGTYSRTYSVTVKYGGTAYTATYTTPASSYPVVLDVTDVPLEPAESYNKRINDLTIKHNSEATAWIGKASRESQPQFIAQTLATALASQGVPAATYNSCIVVDVPGQEVTMEVSDGGDGGSMLAAALTVQNVDQLTKYHIPGKVVRVQPKKSDESDAYYMRAVGVVPGVTGWQEVRWVETAGFTMIPGNVFQVGTIKDGTLLVGSTVAALDTLTGEDNPKFLPNVCGDEVSAVLPYFFGNTVTYLGLFQDRLVIGAGSVLFFSRPGDYFNWFRESVLNVEDSDPVEMYALGSEDDIIYHSVTFDRNLSLFGFRHQYMVSGRTPLTPRSASIMIQSSYEDAVDAPPINSGNLVFYSKYRNGYSSMHQIQIGLVQDSPESFEISRPLDSYLRGRPVEILTVTSPNTVLLRTESQRNSLYVYHYLDTAASQERLFDAWSQWQFPEECGKLLGVSRHQGDVLLYWLRQGMSNGQVRTWLSVDVLMLDTELSAYPYLDSHRQYTDDPAAWRPVSTENAYVALDSGSDTPFIGSVADRMEEVLEDYLDEKENMRYGLGFNAYVEPTNPYMRDRNDKVVTTGRLVLTRVIATLADTGALLANATFSGSTKTVREFTGRLTGRAPNKVGVTPVVDTTVTIPIGRETNQVRYSLHSKLWLPLTVTALEWVGQYFSNSRRV